MARVITNELALKIVNKLKAMPVASASKKRDLYAVEHDGRVVATISIRRASEKDKGHDYIPRDLHISPRQAKLLGQCPWKRVDFIAALQEKGLLAEETEDGEQGT
jgi:uncharacterized protein YkuJ